MKTKKTVSVLIIIFLIFSFKIFANADANTVNISAALKTLKKASDLYDKKRFKESLCQTQLGEIYDPKTADFFYLGAICELELDYPIGDVIKKVEKALDKEMVWRLYELSAAHILAAKINCQLLKYDRALSLINKLPYPTADGDFLKATAAYGLKKNKEARTLINIALNRWPLDPRFPNLFFLNEKAKTITESAKALSSKIISKLHIWEELNPELIILASPFEVKSKENIRRLKIYRNNHIPTNKPYQEKELFYLSYSILLCLRYGIIDEKTAMEEFFHLTSYYDNPILKEINLLPTMYEPHLVELLRLVANKNLREKIKSLLDTYHGLILNDTNNDLIIDSRIYYRNGRPYTAEFNTSQDGYPEYLVKCDFGIPETVYGKHNKYEIEYKNYPAVKEITYNDRKYLIRPNDLVIESFFITKLDLKLHLKKSESFFTLKIAQNENNLNAQLLREYAISSKQKDNTVEDGENVIYYDNGKPLTKKITVGSEIYSITNYKNGNPFITKIDKDGDSYFETKIEYSTKGKISKISIDLNKNKFYEYIEKYLNDDSIIKTWDTNEDNQAEISYTEYQNGDSQSQWIHPKKNKIVKVFFSKGTPKQLVDGSEKVNIIRIGKAPVFWLRNVPPFPYKINEKILEMFNQNELTVVSHTININNLEIYAIKSGGFIFAEIINK